MSSAYCILPDSRYRQLHIMAALLIDGMILSSSPSEETRPLFILPHQPVSTDWQPLRLAEMFASRVQSGNVRHYSSCM